MGKIKLSNIAAGFAAAVLCAGLVIPAGTGAAIGEGAGAVQPAQAPIVAPGQEKPNPGQEKPNPGQEKPNPGQEKPNPGQEKPNPEQGKPKPGAKKITIDNKITNGKVTSNKATAAKDETVSLTVTPSDGYACDTVTVSYQEGASKGAKTKTIPGVSCKSLSFKMVDKDVVVSATFKALPTYTIKFSANYWGAGAPEVIKTDTKGKLVSTPAEPTLEDYTFDGWYTRSVGGHKVDLAGTFRQDATYYAHWERNVYNVTVVTEGDGTAQATATQSISGKYIGLTATPGENTHFVGWEVVSGDTTVETHGKYTWFEMPKSDVVIKAVFDEYHIITGANSTWARGSQSGLNIVGDGELDKLVEVLVDGNSLGANNFTAITGSTDVTLTPEFLGKLADGEHDFAIVWADGTASTKFSIATPSPVNPVTPVTPVVPTQSTVVAAPASTVSKQATKTAPNTGVEAAFSPFWLIAAGLILGGVALARKSQA